MGFRTGILGTSASALGDFVLGAGPSPAAQVVATPGLTLFYRCEDASASTVAIEEFGRNATAVSAGSTTAMVSAAGVDGKSLQTPVATAAVAPPPFTKVVTPHIKFAYTGADVNPGAAGTIECWVRFQELGDAFQTGSPNTPAAPYEFLNLSQSTNSISLQIANPASINAVWTDSVGTSRSAVFAPLNPGINNELPAAELNRWYYIAFTWDSSSVAGYCNGVLIFTSTNHPPSYTAANFSFGGAGAQYDLVGLVNRKMTKEEVANRMVSAGDAVTTSDARVTAFFVNAVAGYAPHVRITKGSIEALRTGSRQARVSKAIVEVLRTTATPVFVNATDTITFGNLATAAFGKGATDLITFGDLAGLTRSVGATDTITFSDNGHTQRVGVHATDTITFSDVASWIGIHGVHATDTITFTDTASPHNTIIRVGAVDSVVFGGDDFLTGGGTWNRLLSDTLTFADRADAHNTTVQAGAIDSIVFSDFGGHPQTWVGTALDQITFGDGASGGGAIAVHATDTITFSSSTPNQPRIVDTLTLSDVAHALQPHQRNTDTLTITDEATGRAILPHPELGLSVVLRSQVSFEWPFCYCQTPDGMILIANGIDPVYRWEPSDKTLDTAGVKPATEPGTLAATPFVNTDALGNVIPSPAYRFYTRFVDRYGNLSDLGPVSVDSLGQPPFVYSSVPVPTETKVVRRQILRNPAGSANTYYVEIDTTDLHSTTFTGTMDDETLIAQPPQAVVGPDGSLIANIHGVPPAHKSCLAYHLGRVFAAVDVEYSTGNAVVVSGSAVVQGVGTRWTEVMANRAFWVVGARDFYTIDHVDQDAQTLTLTAVWQDVSDQYAQYTIRPQPEERRLVYFTESGEPEGWPVTYALQVMEDGDEITGLVAFNSFLYIIESRNSYKLTFRNDPLTDGNIFNSTNRGCVSQRCIVAVGDDCYMLDELGVHKFDGDSSEPVSMAIQDIFQGNTDGLSINWDADTTLWHAAWDSAREVIRWFLSFGSDREPHHALCYQYNLQRWWVERYDRPIASSADGILGNIRSFVGSSGRAVLVLSEGFLDGANENNATRGQVAAWDSMHLSASERGTVADALVGFPVAIAAGRGRGQVRTVVSRVADRVQLDRPLMVTPGPDSIYQFGGFSWEWRSGWFQLSRDEESNARNIEVVYQPTRRGASFDLNLYYNHDDQPRRFDSGSDDDGVTIRANSPDVTVTMDSKAGGYALLRKEGHREIYMGGDRFVSIALAGVGAAEAIRIYSVTAEGMDN